MYNKTHKNIINNSRFKILHMNYTTDQIQSDKLIKKNHILIKMKLYSINT